MNKKLFSVFIGMLLITTILPGISTPCARKEDSNDRQYQEPVVGETNAKYHPFLFKRLLQTFRSHKSKVVGGYDDFKLYRQEDDQNQTDNCGYGFQIRPPFYLAQGFQPSIENLTAVQLHIFKAKKPPAGIEITVSIRESLDGNDLTSTAVKADKIMRRGTWVWLNFPDITVTPGTTYYIVCSGGGGDEINCYCWFFDLNNSYDKGEAWISDDSDSSWITIENYWGDPRYQGPDFCFKTYFTKSKNKVINTFFLRFLENHPHLFQLLGDLLRL